MERSFSSSIFLGLASVLLRPGVSGQTFEPAIEIASLLDLRFYEQTGGFLVENLQLVFPPQADPTMEFAIKNSSGGTVVGVPLRKETTGEMNNFSAFAHLQPSGHPGNIQVGQTGDFVMVVNASGQAITTLPFSLRSEGGDDPFNPQKKFILEGPWRTLAYLAVPADEPDAPVSFKWWMSKHDLPPGMNRALCTIHLMQGNKELVVSRTKIDISDLNKTWTSNVCDFYMQKEKKLLTIPMLTVMEGNYRIVIKAGDKILKSYAFDVNGGKLQRLPRCDLKFKPHTQFISPRLVDTSSRHSNYRMMDAYWVEASGIKR